MIKKFNSLKHSSIRMNFLMNYCVKNTLSENYQNLIEQFGDSKDWSDTTGDAYFKEKNIEQNVERRLSTYPNYCSYPEFALTKGFKNMLQGYCYYPSPKQYSMEGGKEGIWIPKDAKITFWTDESLRSWIDQIWSSWYENGKISGWSKTKLIKNVQEIFPVGSIQNFSFSGGTYLTRAIFNYKQYGEDKKWMFKGYFRSGDNLEYEKPEYKDIRTPRQKFIDNWGLVLQIGGVIGTIILGGLTGGATWALSLEILAELTIGGFVAHREIEKGENVSAFFSAITALLPTLKLTKWFRGIDESLFNELAQDISRQTITNEDDALRFYNSITNPEKKKLFQKIFLQDEISEEILEGMVRKLRTVENLNIPPYVSTSDMLKISKKMIEDNVDIIGSLKFWDKLWARELTSNVIAGVLDIVSQVTLGEKLDDQKKRAIEWVYTKVPDSHKKEFIYNLANNIEYVDKIQDKVDESHSETAENFTKLFSTGLKQDMEEKGKKYVELPSDPLKTGEILPDDESIKKDLINKGWVQKSELQGRTWDDVKFVGNDLFFKLKLKDELKKEILPQTDTSKADSEIDSQFKNLNKQ